MGKIELVIKLFNTIDLKEVPVIMIPNITVVTLGNAIGLKLYTDVVLIVGMSQIEGKKSMIITRLISMDNKDNSNTEDLIEIVNNSKCGQLTIKYINDELEKGAKIIPVQTEKMNIK